MYRYPEVSHKEFRVRSHRDHDPFVVEYIAPSSKARGKTTCTPSRVETLPWPESPKGTPPLSQSVANMGLSRLLTRSVLVERPRISSQPVLSSFRGPIWKNSLMPERHSSFVSTRSKSTWYNVLRYMTLSCLEETGCSPALSGITRLEVRQLYRSSARLCPQALCSKQRMEEGN